MDKSPHTDPKPELEQAVAQSLRSFLERYEPLRPVLYRYCRYLSRSPWDAEDLAQDTLARAFTHLATQAEPPKEPRAWLFRIASNLWIDQVRRRSAQVLPSVFVEPAEPAPRELREAAGTLLVQLGPQERAAVVLKDAFDLELEDIAQILSTSVGAVKAALHRGRGKLRAPDPELPRTPVPAALDAFCAAFNARDLDRLTALLLEHATIEVVGATTLYGAKTARDTVLWGMVFGSQRMAAVADGGSPESGIDPRFSQGVLPTPARIELRAHRGEQLLISFYAHHDGEFARAVTRVELSEQGDHITRLRNYYYTPEVIAEICSELALPHRINGTFRARGGK
jgi:RNA polymerase sigma-70 factor, ECF subfamily